MTGYACLSGKNDVPASLGRPRKANLSANQSIGADLRSMADLREVVDLYACADAGFSDTGTINAGVGLHLHRILENGGAGLHNLVPYSCIIFGKTEAVRADDSAVLQHNVITDAAMLADNGVRVSKKVVTNERVWVNDNVRQQGSVIANDHAFAHDNISADVRICADLGCRVNDGSRMDAGCIFGLVIKEPHGLREGEVWIRQAQR